MSATMILPGSLNFRLHSRTTFIALSALLLTSCISTQTDWPGEAPARGRFITAYANDPANQQRQSRDDYLRWVRNFYTGTLSYPRGWLDIQSQIVASAGAGERAELSANLHDLGAVIGAEWAKANAVRRIDSRILGLWGSVLQLADLEGKRAESIELISSDVDRLIQGRVSKDDIVESRYARRLDLEFFESF